MKGNRTVRQLILYFIVGVLATVVEWGTFYILDIQLKIHYALSTSLAFVVSTFANWGAGRLMVFKEGDSKGVVHEILCIYAISCIGLLTNLLIMWICIDGMEMLDMFAKILATSIVFGGNFVVRKYWIYK